jgi:pyridoxamine 5'-phosphate oxidase
MQKLADLRVVYDKGVLLEQSLPGNPFELFSGWFTDHRKLLDAQKMYLEPNAMVLSTCNPKTLRPSSRVVLLKHFDHSGLVFYTNYQSRKGQELLANPQAALNFYWDERQVRVEGRVEKLSDEQSSTYYDSRPLGSRLGAWVSSQSKPLANREELEQAFEQVEARFKTEPLVRPPFWGTFSN